MLLVPVHLPAEVLAGGLVDGGGGVGEVGGDVVLEAVFADVAEEVLHVGDLDDAGAAEGVEGIVGEGALADVAADLAGEVVGGEAGEAHGAGFDGAVERAVGVLLADGAGDDLLEVHLYAFVEEVLGEVGAVEADGLVGVVAVVVVPVEQGAGGLAGEGEGVHAEGAEDVDLAGGGDEVFAHHAHDGAGDDAEELLDGGPALDGGDGERAGLHPAVDDGAELGHLESAASGVSPMGMYFLMAASLAWAASSLSDMRAMRPMTSLRSRVSTVMPDFSRSFSE